VRWESNDWYLEPYNKRGPLTTIDETRAYARELHRGQLDQLGQPYHAHLERVLGHLRRLFPQASEAAQHGALLHGCVEEKRTTLAALGEAGYSPEIIDMVRWNTRPRGDGAPAYLDWIRQLADEAPLGAVMIKIADNEDNNDPQRIARLPADKQDVSPVYAKAREILDAALERRRGTAPDRATAG
jgi:(p)ppGpp synthase/HD superfamily hydrolase